jgi:phosphatidylethanolamine-binding protein (PEBP) family uncharacterized protein
MAAGCGGGDGKSLPEAPATLGVTSPAFQNGATIPKRFTCSGENVSPPLRFGGVPAKARGLALIVQDPDADDYLHWAVLDIPPDARGLPAGKRWNGPCPPEGDSPHRYVFALYALDAKVDSRDAVADHAIARGTLVGRFGR